MYISIIGAGLAGLSAALTLAERGIPCALISSQGSERAQSVLAEGGINAALDNMGEDDTTAEHFADTMKGGADLADPNAVKGLTDAAPDIIRRLEGYGVPFHRENGRIAQRNFGGQKKKRTVFAKSSTGKIVMSALTDEVRKYEAMGLVKRFCHHEAVDIDIAERDGRLVCGGVTFIDIYTGRKYHLDGRVILASGGLNGFFPGHTTGTVPNTGRLTALLFSKGIEIDDPEFIQYHPTTVSACGKRLLISEAARGEGGRLFVMRGGERWYFMRDKYPEMGDLMPRDVVSREIWNVTHNDGCGDEVYLDLTVIPADTWQNKLSDMREEIRYQLGIDPVNEPVKISPGIHFFMGGICVDKCHRTNADGLYAAGECACQYHGANRLGGNSMLGALYGGLCAADGLAGEDVLPPEPLETGSDGGEVTTGFPDGFDGKLCDILLSGLGIVRDEKTMQAAVDRLGVLEREDLDDTQRQRLYLGKAMLMGALLRKESRGAHFRSDYPERDENYRKMTVAKYKDGGIDITYRDIPELEKGEA